MDIKALFDKKTSTLTYVVYDSETKDAVIIDPVLDFDANSTSISSESIDLLTGFVFNRNLKVHYILETHAHADHLSSSKVLVDRYFPNAKIGIGRDIIKVQETFKPVFSLGDDFKIDGSQFDLLLTEGDQVNAGSLNFKVLATPGHTPACISYKIEDAVFTGDALFMPDSGTGRCDFPLGSSSQLYRSVSDKIYGLDETTRIFVGHDYQPENREVMFETTVKESMSSNRMIKGSTSLDEFTEFRDARDKTLNAPKLLFQSIQVNIVAGEINLVQKSNKLQLIEPDTAN